MSESKVNKKLLGLITPYAVTVIIASNLAVFKNSITMGPDKAGFWMVLALGLSLGASIMATVLLLRKKNA